MRRAVSILISVALLFNILGYYLAFRAIEKGYKRLYRQHIYYSFYTGFENSEELTILDSQLNADNQPFSTIENDEFVYSGKNFEIIKCKKQKINHILYCFGKNNEHVFSRFKQYMKHHDNSNAPYQQKNQKITAQIIKEAINEHRKPLLFPKDIKDRNFYYFFSIQSAVVNNIFVPPKVS